MATWHHATRAAGAGSTRSAQFSGPAGSPDSRLSSTLSRISHHPPVVFTFTPSVLNSHSPAALASALPGASSDRTQRPARSPSSSHTARMVSLLTLMRHSSRSLFEACSNDQLLPATASTRRACSLTIRRPSPAHASSGVWLAPHAGQAK